MTISHEAAALKVCFDNIKTCETPCDFCTGRAKAAIEAYENEPERKAAMDTLIEAGTSIVLMDEGQTDRCAEINAAIKTLRCAT